MRGAVLRGLRLHVFFLVFRPRYSGSAPGVFTGIIFFVTGRDPVGGGWEFLVVLLKKNFLLCTVAGFH